MCVKGRIGVHDIPLSYRSRRRLRPCSPAPGPGSVRLLPACFRSVMSSARPTKPRIFPPGSCKGAAEKLTSMRAPSLRCCLISTPVKVSPCSTRCNITRDSSGASGGIDGARRPSTSSRVQPKMTLRGRIDLHHPSLGIKHPNGQRRGLKQGLQFLVGLPQLLH